MHLCLPQLLALRPIFCESKSVFGISGQELCTDYRQHETLALMELFERFSKWSPEQTSDASVPGYGHEQGFNRFYCYSIGNGILSRKLASTSSIWAPWKAAENFVNIGQHKCNQIYGNTTRSDFCWLYGAQVSLVVGTSQIAARSQMAVK